MKNLIVLAAVLPFLLLFMMQFTLDQKNSGNIGRLQSYVYTAKEEAKQKGCFTDEIENRMREKIARDFQINQNEIQVEVTKEVQYRVNQFENEGKKIPTRGMIYYRVAVPIEKVIAGNRFFGIKDKENKGEYIIESYTASERLPLETE
ncbi:hypothetical protein [Anaerovorax sp. IOR16]|uniref:hypothetical protein n=1 Tax=Anaerovorax sp. IOR16 TaxID=2773458 RepID=UPI0019D0C834|nr:hypothetical protein [Anaerovorax sp. IOR16]